METSCTILDLKNVTLKQVANYYPERMGIPPLPSRSVHISIHPFVPIPLFRSVQRLTLGRFYMINSPRGFSTVWQVIKRFLDTVTVEKISILGKDYQATLLSQIPKENLPKRFGGECQCPGGCEMSDAGPWQEEQWARPLTSQTCTTKAESEVSIVRQQGDKVDGMERLAIPRV